MIIPFSGNIKVIEMMKSRIGYTTLIIATTFLLSGCFDAEINTELKGDGGGRITIICIANPIYAGAFQGKTMTKDAKVRNYIRGDRFYHEESATFKSVDETGIKDSIIRVYSNPTELQFSIIEQRFSPSYDPLLAGMFIGRKFTYRLHLPWKIHQAFSTNVGGIEIEPVIKGNTVSWQLPLDFLYTNQSLISFRVEVYGEKGELFSSWEDKALSWFKQFFQREEKNATLPASQTFIPPIDAPQFSVKPSNDYAAFNLIGNNKYHVGIDIISAWHPLTDTPVYAVTNGVAEDVFGTADADRYCDGTTLNKNLVSADNHGYGNVVILRHDNGLYSLYAHLDCIDKDIKKGAIVKQGQKIGKMGNSSYEKRVCGQNIICNPSALPLKEPIKGFGKHLHFEIRKFGTLHATDKNGNPYWGYTFEHPDELGYLDPKKYIGGIAEK